MPTELCGGDASSPDDRAHTPTRDMPVVVSRRMTGVTDRLEQQEVADAGGPHP